MLIGLLSDTHIASASGAIPAQVYDALQGVDLILHAGDLWVPSVLDKLEKIAPVLAARGDDDMEADVGDDSRVKRIQVLTIEGLKLWAMHVKPRYGLINPKEDLYPPKEDIYPNKLNSEDLSPPDIVVFGHTHHAKIENYKGVLLVNPGSPNLPDYVPELGTVAFLTINSGKAEARIVQLG